jgi:hypothetical protein
MFWNNLKHRIHELCKHNKNQDELINMFIQFAHLLLHNKSHPQLKDIIQQHQDINVEDVWHHLYQVRSSHRNDNILVDNMKKSLEMIKLMNIVIIRVYEMKNVTFDLFNSEHILLLNELWNNLRPDLPRSLIDENNNVNTNIITPDWVEIGFQGNDPTTDFRGMGILGLTQLYYFSRNRNQAARLILQVFTQEKSRYYPFAIIGINITRFLLDLIEENRIQKLLIENLGHSLAADLHTYQILPSADPICIEFGLNVINDIYCIIFEEFYLQWVIANPVNIMSFSAIFDQVKLSIRNKYPVL